MSVHASVTGLSRGRAIRTKRDWEATALQRQAFECVSGAKTKGVSLTAYCRARGVAVRQVYDALIPSILRV